MVRGRDLLAAACCVAAAGALSPSAAPPRHVLANEARLSRRALVAGCGFALSLHAALPASAKDKGYLTLEEYNKQIRQDKTDEQLYGKFAALRFRAPQTSEFDKLAADKDFNGISTLARNWDTTARKELLEAAAKELNGPAKEQGLAINKAVLADLKALDKLAKAQNADDVPAGSKQLREHVIEFLALEPARLGEKFAMDDL